MIGTYKYRTKVFEAGYKTLAYDQCLALTEIRVDDPERENISLQVFRGVAGCMDKASRPFFRRVKEKEKEGFSRFKRNASWCAIEENLVRLEFRENREEAR